MGRHVLCHGSLTLPVDLDRFGGTAPAGSARPGLAPASPDLGEGTQNGLKPAAKKFEQMQPDEFAYIQISLDGGSAKSHDAVRGKDTFDTALETVSQLTRRGFDTRLICTVNRANQADCLELLDIGDKLGVSLVKYHVFSVIGRGHSNEQWAMQPPEWIEFYEHLERVASRHSTRVWYQPTYARRERLKQYSAQGYRGCIFNELRKELLITAYC